jgi:hypothetical protein
MNRQAQLRNFFEKTSRDARLSTLHVALYHTLLIYWMTNKGKAEFKINDVLLRKAGKIPSMLLYQRCLKELEEWGYLRYFPSQQPEMESIVSLTGIFGCSVPGRKRIGKTRKMVLPAVNKRAGAWPELDMHPSGQGVFIKLAQLLAQAAIQILISHLNKYIDLF